MKKTISRKSVIKAQPKRVVKSTASASKPLAKAKTGGATKSLVKAEIGIAVKSPKSGAKKASSKGRGTVSASTAKKKVNPSMKQGSSYAVLSKTGTSNSTLSRSGFTPAPPRSISAYESDPNYRETMRKIKGPDESTYSRDKMTKTKTKVKTPTKPKGKTVAEVWKDKTGLSWSDAKKLGFSDGTSSTNLKLLKKLNDGEITRNSIMGYDKSPEPVNPTISPKAVTTSGGSGMGAIEREMAMAEETFRKGGSVKKYKRGGTIKSKKK